jgi:hypothetical protein
VGGCCISVAQTDGEVELTSHRYKGQVVRGEYSSLKQENVKFFQSILSEDRVILDTEEICSYNVDWLRTMRGKLRQISNKSMFILSSFTFRV